MFSCDWIQLKHLWQDYRRNDAMVFTLHLSGCARFQFDPLPEVFTLITWLRWCLPMTLFIFVINKDFVKRYIESIKMPFHPKLFDSFTYLFLSIWSPIFQFYSVGYNLLLSLFWGSNHPQFGQRETCKFLCFLTQPINSLSTSLLFGPKDAPESYTFCDLVVESAISSRSHGSFNGT